ncbi:MAG: DUF2845 domain-containing protein [Pseudomonadales bacterium]|jgi:hypothetical protein|nr:DUF2845 domain-containing protein [Pseudomonadales bacterium]
MARPIRMPQLVPALTALLAASAFAGDHLRCGKTFIRNGDSKYEVLKNCGEPVFRDRISGEDSDTIEQWVYETSWSRFPRMITFVAGRVARIERLDDD